MLVYYVVAGIRIHLRTAQMAAEYGLETTIGSAWWSYSYSFLYLAIYLFAVAFTVKRLKAGNPLAWGAAMVLFVLSLMGWTLVFSIIGIWYLMSLQDERKSFLALLNGGR